MREASLHALRGNARATLTASAHDIILIELAAHSASLEEAFFELTRDSTAYRAGQLAGPSKGI